MKKRWPPRTEHAIYYFQYKNNFLLTRRTYPCTSGLGASLVPQPRPWRVPSSTTLGEKFDALGPAAKAYERSLSVEKVKNFDKAIAELSKEQEKGIKLTYNHATGQAVAGETTEAYTERQEKLAAEIERLNSLRDEEISRTDDVTTATEDLIKQLNNEYNELTLTGDALYEYQASQVL